MRRALVAGLVAAALAAGGCGGAHKAAIGSNTPRITVGASGPLASALLTQTQLRQVPSLSTATVTPLSQAAVFGDPDPRGPCGGKVPVVPLTNAEGVAISATSIRAGAELVTRLSRGAAQAYLDARMADTRQRCPEYQTITNERVTQRVLLVRVVTLHNDVEQGLAVVLAVKAGGTVRAATEIEVRDGDVLARTIIFTPAPMDDTVTRGIASLMAQDLATLDN